MKKTSIPSNSTVLGAYTQVTAGKLLTHFYLRSTLGCQSTFEALFSRSENQNITYAICNIKCYI